MCDEVSLALSERVNVRRSKNSRHYICTQYCVCVLQHAMEWSLELWNYDYCIIIIIAIIIIIGAHKVIRNSIGGMRASEDERKKINNPFLITKACIYICTVRQLSTIREERKRVKPSDHHPQYHDVLSSFFSPWNGVLKKLLMLCVYIYWILPHKHTHSFNFLSSFSAFHSTHIKNYF